MASTKISDLTAAATLSSTDTLPIVQTPGAGPVKATPAQLKTYIETGGTVTSSDPVLDLAQTFNNAAVVFEGLKIGVTNTTSNAGSKVFVTYIGGVPSVSNTVGGSLHVYDAYTDENNYGRLALNAKVTGDWVQIAAETAGTAGDNYGIALTPAGTGAISAQVPDSTAAGGNARGANAVDWQSAARGAATQVASGANSTVSGGQLNSATGANSVIGGGNTNSATGNTSTVSGGNANTASGFASAVLGGTSNEASGTYSWVPGGFQASTRGLLGAGAYSSGRRSATGDAQVILQPVRQTTSATSIAYLTTDAAAVSATNCMVLPVNSGCMFTATVTAVHGAGAAVGGWRIEGAARRGASGDATVVGVATTAFGPDAAIGAPTVTVIANVGGAGAGGIVIAVTPDNTTTTYWVGKLELVQGA